MAKYPSHESIRFEVADWWLEYWIMVTSGWRPGDVVPRCSEMCRIKISGPLYRKTPRRRADSALLTIDPNGGDPKQWREEWKSVGLVHGVRRGAIHATVYLSGEPFDRLLTALSAQKIRRLYLGAERTDRRGEGAITLFSTVDRDDDEDED